MSDERPGHVIIEAAAARLMRIRATRSGTIVTQDGGDVARVSDEPGPDVEVLYADSFADLPAPSGDPTVLCAVVGDEIRCFTRALEPLDATVLPDQVDIFDRVRGVFETDVLRDRSVAVLGLGSGGSVILRELARSGVGRFLLVDHDRMEIGNVSRHECGLSDVGRLKTNAARDLVLDRNPAAEVVTRTIRIGSDTADDLSAAVTEMGVDLVVCATDNRPSRLLVNRLCVLSRLPALYAGVFRRAYGGQVLRYIPDLTPCYQCFVNALPQMDSDREISSGFSADRIAYSDRPVAVEPGLASDIAPVALMVVKLAIQELLTGTETTLDSLDEDLVAPLYLWLNRREADTEYATWQPMATGVEEMSVLRWYGVGLARDEACAVCGTMTVEGVAADADLDLSAFQPPAP